MNCKRKLTLIFSFICLGLSSLFSQDCTVSDLEIATLECNDDGTYGLIIDFNYSNPNNDFFDLFAGDLFVDYFELADLPITIESFPASGNSWDYLHVCINDNPDCCSGLEFEAPNCGSDCSISNVYAETYECDENNQFLVDFEFDYQNTGGSFTVVGDGNNYGAFDYGQTYYTVGPFNGDGTVYELVIVDNQNEDCSNFTTIGPITCGTDCDISNIFTEAYECDDNGQYLVDFEFDYQNPGASFMVVSNGNNYGTFDYGETFYTVGPFNGDGTVYELIIVDNQNEDCSASTIISPVNCDNGTCTITELAIETLECNDDGTYGLIIDFNFSFPGNDFFKVFVGDIQIGFYSLLDDIPLTIDNFPASGNNWDHLTVCLSDNPNCCETIEFEAPNCGNECSISNISTEIPVCDDNGQFMIHFEFDYQYTGESFTVVGNGNNYGTFDYGQPSYSVGPFNGNGSTYELIIVDNENEECSAFTTIEAVDCDDDPCFITELEVEVLECNDDGTYGLVINFEYGATTSDFFTIFREDIIIGTYDLGQLPLTIDNFPASGNPWDYFQVCFDDNFDCCSGTEFEAPNCGNDCSINDLEVQTLECNDDGTYGLVIDFNYSNPNNDFFDLIVGDQFVGFFELADLPITIESFPASGNSWDHLTVCVNDNPNCCADLEFEAPNCGGDCDISDIFTENYDCDENNQFYVDFNFESQNTGPTFTVVGNGNNYGTFEYGQSFYTVGPFNGNGSTYELIIVDNENEECSAFTTIEAVECDDDPCFIAEVEVEVLECNDDGTYGLIINFEYGFPTSDFFTIFREDVIIGTFDLGQLPLTIESFPASGNPWDYFQVCFDDNFDCCSGTEFEAPNCDGDCFISNVFAEVHECDDNGQFMVDFEFDYENTGGSFMVVGNGNNYGTFDYGQTFYTVGPFNGDGAIYELIIVDNENENCSDFTTIGPITCDGDLCSISDLEVQTLECNDDGTYGLIIDFNYSFPTNDFFDLIVGDLIIGTADFGDLPLTIEAFPGSGNDWDHLTICVNDNLNCCADIEFEAPDCGDEEDTWPGDTNNDNIANHFDLLFVGLGNGTSGSEREEISISWQAFPSMDWEDSFEDGSNFKYADANGDGMINPEDVIAIDENFNLTHGPYEPFTGLEGTVEDPPLFVSLPSAAELAANPSFEAPVIFGTDTYPVSDAYGLAFTINYDPMVIDPANVNVVINDSWLGENNSELISIVKSLDAGAIHVALSRLNQENVDGNGPIAHFIGIIDDVLGKEQVQVDVNHAYAISSSETPIPLYTPIQNVNLKTGIQSALSYSISIFPNPTADYINVLNNGSANIESLKVINVLGQTMTVKQAQSPLTQIDVSNWAAGIYILEMKVEGQRVVERIKVTSTK